MSVENRVLRIAALLAASAASFVHAAFGTADARDWSPVEKLVSEYVTAGKTADLAAIEGEAALSAGFLRAIVSDPGLVDQVPKSSGVRISGAVISETLDLSEVAIPFRLELESCRFEGAVELKNATAEDSISFAGSEFLGKLDMDGVRIGRNLVLTETEIDEIEMRSATVDGHIDMRGARFCGAVNLRRTRVGKYLNMDGSQHHQGPALETTLHAVHIGETLSLQNARVNRLLQLRRITTGLALQLRNTTTNSQIVLHDARIGGNLTLTGGRYADINLTGAQIEGELRLVSTEHEAASWEAGSELNLRNAFARFFQDPTVIEAWPDRLNLTGFSYELIGGYAARDSYADSKALIRWLAGQEQYAPQPYRQLAEVLSAMGYDATARDVLYANKERSRKTSSGLAKLNLTLQWLLVGYGHAYWLSIVWVIGLTVLGTWVIGKDAAGSSMTKFERALFSFDRLVPIVKISGANYRNDPQGKVGYYFYFHTLVGWIVASYLVGAMF